MAYRTKQGNSRVSTLKEEIRRSTPDESSSYSSPTLAAQAIRASSAHRSSSFSSAYGEWAFTSAYRDSNRKNAFPVRQDSTSYEYTSMKSLNEPKYGFWGVLARKAKSILEDDSVAQQFDKPVVSRPQMLETQTGGEFHQSCRSPDSSRKTDSSSFHKGFNAITSSLNYIGGTIGNALEEGITIMENKTADIIQETRKLNIRKKGRDSVANTQSTDVYSTHQQSHMHTDQETQLKASRDVAMAMAAKAKLLIRELKTIKADLAFTKQHCSQLEDENRILRENHDKGSNPEDDDLIRLQLETLLAEKARLAQENSIYARENRFLREIVEYHQLTMQDVVYLDEGIEEVKEVSPISIPAASGNYPFPTPSPPPEALPPLNQAGAKDIFVSPAAPSMVTEGSL